MLGLGSGINRLSAAEAAAIAGRIPGFTGLLDESYGASAEAAYSVRKLTNRVSVAMTIRRDSDSTETDIGFDSNGNLDEGAITAFCTGTTCRVASWKDQSGNDNHAIQAVASNQPTIYTGGALVKENGKVALDFDGASDYLSTSNGVANDPELTIFQTCIATGTNTGVQINYALPQIAGSHTDPYGRLILLRRFGDTMITRLNGGTTSQGSGSYPLSKTLFTLNSKQGFVDASGTNTGTFTGADITYPNSVPFIIGANGGAGENWEGKNQEIIVYASDKSSADQTSIESNVGDYFTQNTPLLDTYTGAAAAYSLRKLSSSYSGPAIRVRRDNDNLETDINFNVFGELDTVSLAAHCGSNNGYVTNWYDQSSNSNTARQTTAANQPKIYDGTTGVVTENGKPAMNKNASGNGHFSLTASFSPAITDRTVFSVTKTTGGRQEIIYGGSLWIFNVNASGSGTSLYNGSGYIGGSGGSITSQALRTGYFNSTGNSSIWTNGSNQVDGAAGSNTMSSISTIGAQGAGFRVLDAMQEVVLYPSNETTNRTGIETNMNTFYDIY